MEQNDTFYKKLVSIGGIGDKLAKKLIGEGITSIEELNEHIDELPEITQIYLKNKICKRLPRKYIRQLIEYLPKNWIPVGSYRRQVDISRDVDFLTMNDLQYESDILNIISKIAGTFNILAEFQSGTAKRSFIISFGGKNIQMDLFKTDPDSLPFALFHYTGSKVFNIRTRAHAKKLGYKLNQYGLFKKEAERIKLKNENEIFKFLNITYKPPSKRNE